MEESILISIKEMLTGTNESYGPYDREIMTHINTHLMTLTQLGVGPKDGFMISSDAETWKDFLGESGKFEMAKTYVYVKVKLVFDPPSSGTYLQSLKEEADTLEWRLNMQAESNESQN